jgi:hypothetical protein
MWCPGLSRDHFSGSLFHSDGIGVFLFLFLYTNFSVACDLSLVSFALFTPVCFCQFSCFQTLTPYLLINRFEEAPAFAAADRPVSSSENIFFFGSF